MSEVPLYRCPPYPCRAGSGVHLALRGLRSREPRNDRNTSLGRTGQHQHLVVLGTGFRVQGSGFRVQGSGCRVQGSSSTAFAMAESTAGSEDAIRIRTTLVFGVWSLGMRVGGYGLRVEGLVLRV